jgi:hypothetical protein
MLSFGKSSKRNLGFFSTTSLTVLSSLLCSSALYAMDEPDRNFSPPNRAMPLQNQDDSQNDKISPYIHYTVEECKRAAENGDPLAQNHLGHIYLLGIGVEEDYPQALHYYQLSAAQGNAIANNNLGYIYLNGKGVEQDEQQAIHYYTLSAEQGYAPSRRILGLLYYKTEAYQNAFPYLKEAADQGDADVQYMLGRMYKKGLGIQADDKMALHYFTLSANQGYELALKKVLRNVSVSAASLTDIDIFNHLIATKKTASTLEEILQNPWTNAIRNYWNDQKAGLKTLVKLHNGLKYFPDYVVPYFAQRFLDLPDQECQQALQYLMRTSCMFCAEKDYFQTEDHSVELIAGKLLLQILTQNSQIAFKLHPETLLEIAHQYSAFTLGGQDFVNQTIWYSMIAASSGNEKAYEVLQYAATGLLNNNPSFNTFFAYLLTYFRKQESYQDLCIRQVLDDSQALEWMEQYVEYLKNNNKNLEHLEYFTEVQHKLKNEAYQRALKSWNTAPINAINFLGIAVKYGNKEAQKRQNDVRKSKDYRVSKNQFTPGVALKILDREGNYSLFKNLYADKSLKEQKKLLAHEIRQIAFLLHSLAIDGNSDALAYVIKLKKTACYKELQKGASTTLSSPSVQNDPYAQLAIVYHYYENEFPSIKAQGTATPVIKAIEKKEETEKKAEPQKPGKKKRKKNRNKGAKANQEQKSNETLESQASFSPGLPVGGAAFEAQSNEPNEEQASVPPAEAASQAAEASVPALPPAPQEETPAAKAQEKPSTSRLKPSDKNPRTRRNSPPEAEEQNLKEAKKDKPLKDKGKTPRPDVAEKPSKSKSAQEQNKQLTLTKNQEILSNPDLQFFCSTLPPYTPAAFFHDLPLLKGIITNNWEKGKGYAFETEHPENRLGTHTTHAKNGKRPFERGVFEAKAEALRRGVLARHNMLSEDTVVNHAANAVQSGVLEHSNGSFIEQAVRGARELKKDVKTAKDEAKKILKEVNKTLKKDKKGKEPQEKKQDAKK